MKNDGYVDLFKTLFEKKRKKKKEEAWHNQAPPLKFKKDILKQ